MLQTCASVCHIHNKALKHVHLRGKMHWFECYTIAWESPKFHLVPVIFMGCTVIIQLHHVHKPQQKTILTTEDYFDPVEVCWIICMCACVCVFIPSAGSSKLSVLSLSKRVTISSWVNSSPCCRTFIIFSIKSLTSFTASDHYAQTHKHTHTDEIYLKKTNKLNLILIQQSWFQYLLLVSGLVSGRTTGLCGWKRLERRISWRLRLGENPTTPHERGQRVGMAHQNHRLNQFCQRPSSLSTRTNQLLSIYKRFLKNNDYNSGQKVTSGEHVCF